MKEEAIGLIYKKFGSPKPHKTLLQLLSKNKNKTLLQSGLYIIRFIIVTSKLHFDQCFEIRFGSAVESVNLIIQNKSGSNFVKNPKLKNPIKLAKIH